MAVEEARETLVEDKTEGTSRDVPRSDEINPVDRNKTCPSLAGVVRIVVTVTVPRIRPPLDQRSGGLNLNHCPYLAELLRRRPQSSELRRHSQVPLDSPESAAGVSPAVW